MNGQRTIGKLAWFAICFLFLVAATASIRIFLFSSADPISAGVEARQLIEKHGGTAKLCVEADEIFRRFGGAADRDLRESDLKNYPEIAALGEFPQVVPGIPRELSIHVGTHLRGYFIEFVYTNRPGSFPTSASTVTLLEGRIYVHR